MLSIVDENNIIRLYYATNKYHPKAIWFDIKKGICKFKAWELKQELDAYSRVYEDCPLLNFLIILVDDEGKFVNKLDNEFFDCRYLHDLTINYLDEILDNNFYLYVDKCEINLVKPLKYQNIKRKKRARRRTHIPRGLKKEVFMRDDYTCQECGARKGDKKTNGEKVRIEVDHIIPVVKGGTDTLDNLQTLCKDCNLNKFDLIQ